MHKLGKKYESCAIVRDLHLASIHLLASYIFDHKSSIRDFYAINYYFNTEKPKKSKTIHRLRQIERRNLINKRDE